MFSFEKLEVWKKSVNLCEELLILADQVSKSDRYSVGEQLRRAAISVSNNIAEGGGRNYKKEKVYFYNIARGSIYEIVNLLEICKRRKHLGEDVHTSLYQKAEEIAKMLSGLIGSSRFST
jgi:four helix bundle protein